MLVICLYFVSVKKGNTYAIVDIETTGGHAGGNGITEIAIFIHDGNKVVERFETLINPLQSIPYHITSLTGISDEMVAGAPTFEEVAEKIYELLKHSIFVAHHVNFDHSFIRHQLKQWQFEWQVKKLCTVRMSRKIFPGLLSYSLGNLCRHMHIPIENRHRASGDALATVALFEKLLANDTEGHINAMLSRKSGEHWLPIQLDKAQIEVLPEAPGVYYFKNAAGKVIYVGKAINIRKRVVSHFNKQGIDKRTQLFLRQISAIDHKVCVNELHALVLESAEIKRLWPSYNKSQKQPLRQYGLYQFEDKKGYIRLAIDRKKKGLPVLCQFNLLHEGLVMLRKLAVEFNLNLKYCLLDKTPITEEDYAMMGNQDQYNQKVQKALKALAIRMPTFAVVDEGLKKNEQLYLLIERGSFWGMGYLEKNLSVENINSLKELIEPMVDNDFIRNSLYQYVENHPEKKLVWNNEMAV